MSLEFGKYVRKPFEVEAVQITEENIGEVAEHVGELRYKDEKNNAEPYIQVNKRIVPNVFRVYPGFWMTRMGDNIRCYSPKVFKEQFTTSTPITKTWVDYINGDASPADKEVIVG